MIRIKKNIMKNNLKINPILALLLGVFFMFSCESKKMEPLTFENTAKTFKLEITGEQAVSGDPWALTFFFVEGEAKEEIGKTDAYLETPSKENIEVEWTAEKEGVINITQRDGDVKPIPFSAN
jgi:hypothetical protein